MLIAMSKDERIKILKEALFGTWIIVWGSTYHHTATRAQARYVFNYIINNGEWPDAIIEEDVQLGP